MRTTMASKELSTFLSARAIDNKLARRLKNEGKPGSEAPDKTFGGSPLLGFVLALAAPHTLKPEA